MPAPLNPRTVLHELGVASEEPLAGNQIVPLRRPSPESDGRLKSVDSPQGTIVYAYDDWGRRTETTVETTSVDNRVIQYT